MFRITNAYQKSQMTVESQDGMDAHSCTDRALKSAALVGTAQTVVASGAAGGGEDSEGRLLGRLFLTQERMCCFCQLGGISEMLI